MVFKRLKALRLFRKRKKNFIRIENRFPGPGMFNKVSTEHLKIDSSVLESYFCISKSLVIRK